MSVPNKTSSSHPSSGLWSRFFGQPHNVVREKARLEAFLSAIPGEYCGWASDGSVAYSGGFCILLETSTVRDITDILNTLEQADRIALEAAWNELKLSGKSFRLRCHMKNGRKTLMLSGIQGDAIHIDDPFKILWAEDVTRQTAREHDLENEVIALQDRLAMLEKGIEAMALPIWARNDLHLIKHCNPAYAALMGKEIPEILHQQIEITQTAAKSKLIKGKTGPVPGPSLADAALSKGKVQALDTHIIRKGERLAVRVHESPFKDRSGTIGFLEDRTALEELETELKRYKAANNELLQQLRSAIGIYGADEKLDFYNSAFSQLWGLEEQWLNTRPKLGDIMEKLRETRHLPEQADFRKFKQSWLDMFTRLMDPFEDMLYLPNGNALRMLVVPHAMGGLMMTFEDVTSRLELESSYNTLIAVQKETLDNLAEGVAVYGGDGRLKLWNPSFARLWSLNPEDLDGEPHITKIVERMKPLFSDSEWPKLKEELLGLGLDRIMRESRLERKNNTLVDYASVPLPDGGVLVTFTDVSDTVRVENALREKNAALEAAESLKLDFLANVSYQLRTPLNAIMGFNEILDQEYFGPLNEKQKEYTRDTREASERLLNLVNDILDLSTIEAGYLSLEYEDVKIKELLDGLVDLTSHWARKQDIKVSLTVPKNIGKISSDPRRLKQVILNLIRNAITFTPSGGVIHLSAKRQKDKIEIAVKDSGIGISKEDQGRIFEPFERIRTISPEETYAGSRGGAGLGLSLVKNIVELCGGDITVNSVIGEGSTFTLILPLEPPKAAPPNLQARYSESYSNI